MLSVLMGLFKENPHGIYVEIWCSHFFTDPTPKIMHFHIVFI